MTPYRSSAEPLVVVRPKRTLLGRLRSWWRRRFVVGRATWRFRFRRLPCCGYVDRKRRPFLDGAWLLQPLPKECPRCGKLLTKAEVRRVVEIPQDPDPSEEWEEQHRLWGEYTAKMDQQWARYTAEFQAWMKKNPTLPLSQMPPLPELPPLPPLPRPRRR